MFTMIGQLAIPVPVLGGLIGGMIGYALTNTFYQSFFDVLKEAKLSAEQRVITEMKCKAAKELSYAYQKRINKIFTEKLSQLDQDSRAMFAILDNPDISADIKLNANDKVTIYILHNSGSTSQNLTSDPGMIYFSGYKIY